MPRKKTNAELDNADVEKMAFEAMRHHGLISPMTIEEVAQIEDSLDDVELPPSIVDPLDTLKRLDHELDEDSAAIPFVPSESEAERNLARAAREGGAISDSVEQQMREDRKRAEKEHDGGK